MGFKEELGKEVGAGTGRGINRLAYGIAQCTVWLFSFEKGDENRSGVSKNALRTTVLSLLVIVWMQSCGPLKSSAPKATMGDEGQSIQVKVQLNAGPMPPFPGPENFLPTNQTGKSEEFMLGGITFLRYPGNQENSITVINIPSNRPMCALVPRGIQVVFRSKVPPYRVIQMEPSVVAEVKLRDLAWYERIIWWESGESVKTLKRSWQYVRERPWSIQNNEFKARAYREESGGIVCF